MNIRIDTLDNPQVIALIRQHLASMHEHSPPESVHALPLEQLRAPEVTFWTAWDGADLIGCGALKQLDPHHAEIKSMRTVPAHLRKGVASRILEHIIDEAVRRGYRRLSLETGSMNPFKPAQALYARFGFTYCGPFADYWDDPNSVFMSREL